MSTKRKGLGRGLDALLPPKRQDGLQELELQKLTPSAKQPRRSFDPEAIAELAASIREQGVLQPLLVRPLGDGFEIVAGERRYRAAQQAGLTKVPAIVRTLSDQQTLEVAIVENLQREDLSALEEAHAFTQLIAFGLSHDDVAKAVGKSRSAVANTLRLLKLPEEALSALTRGEISPGHARALLAQAPEDRLWALEQVLSRGLTVRQTEALKRPRIAVSDVRSATPYTDIERHLTAHWGTQVKIKGEGRGRVELYFYSDEDLERLLELLNYQP